MTTKRAWIVLLVVIAGIALSLAGVFAGIFITHRQETTCLRQHPLLNGGVVCGNPQVLDKAGYVGLRKILLDYIEKERAAGRVEQVSLYFRDLHNGPVMGVNELENFAPASLLKLPLALIYLNSAEELPELLPHQLRYVGTSAVDLQHFKPGKSAEAGRPYSIEELLRFMISYSDNASYETLNQYLLDDPNRAELLTQGLRELGVIAPQDKLDEVVSTRGYASLFRTLYNVTYLNEELSQKMLTWLTESDFDQGLEAGVPQGTKVAHKFGERLSNSGTRQLHDCGIVYYPDNPYLLCVMTKGNDWNELAKVIAAISEMTYKEVDSRLLK